MIKSLWDARIIDVLPRIVGGQDWVIALSRALGQHLQMTLQFADESQIYTAIDTVSEEILDALAVAWKIDWYDTDYSLERKRIIVKTGMTVRRYMGTVYATRTLAQAIFPGSEIEEWFEYDGEPGTFRIITDTELSDDDVKFFAEMIEKVKNVRSHLETILVARETTMEFYAGVGSKTTYIPAPILEYDSDI